MWLATTFPLSAVCETVGRREPSDDPTRVPERRLPVTAERPPAAGHLRGDASARGGAGRSRPPTAVEDLSWQDLCGAASC